MGGPDITFLQDSVRLTYAENPGAFLGIGASLPAPARAAVFRVAASLIVLGLVLSAFLWPGLSRGRVVALTLLAASGLGNLVDRYLQDGRVTDFLNIGIGNLRTGIFNVADVLGVVAVTLLLVLRKRDATRSR
jgi:signal peptidase II